MIPFGPTYFAGILLGIRHALEPDHLAAVSTLMAEGHGSRHSARIGAAWGIGHGLPLILLCGVLAGFGELPAGLAQAAELVAALVLVGLGANAIYYAFVAGDQGPSHFHRHDGIAHVHAGPSAHLHLGGWTVARRPFTIGLLHGIAGSGALSALVSLSLPTLGARLLYVFLFATGAALTMMAMAAVAARSIGRFDHAQPGFRWLRGASGIASLIIGILWALPVLAALSLP